MSTTVEHDLHIAMAPETDAPGDETRTTPDATVDADLAAVPPTDRSAVQITTVIAVSVVAAVAAVVSFMHMYELAARAGEGWRAWLVPLAIDGLMVAASMTMVVRRRAGKGAGWLAWTSLTLGIAASLAANVAAAEPTLIGRAVAAWPPIALLFAYELLMDQIQVATKHAGAQSFVNTAHSLVPAHLPADTMPLAAVPATAAPTASAPLTGRAQSGTALVDGTTDDSTPAAAWTMSTPSLVLLPVPDQDEDSGEAVRQAARQRYLKTLADGLPCTGRALADMFGMSERWGRYQIRAARRTLTTTADPAARQPVP